MRSAAVPRFSSIIPGFISYVLLRDLRINKIPIFEREGWLCQPSLSKIGILFSCKSLSGKVDGLGIGVGVGIDIKLSPEDKASVFQDQILENQIGAQIEGVTVEVVEG